MPQKFIYIIPSFLFYLTEVTSVKACYFFILNFLCSFYVFSYKRNKTKIKVERGVGMIILQIDEDKTEKLIEEIIEVLKKYI